MKKRPGILTISTRRPQGGVVDEPVFNEAWLRFMYYTSVGAMVRHAVLRTRLFSGLYGKLNRSHRSAHKIRRFITNYDIDTGDLDRPIESFHSFNDFFTRRLKDGARPVDLSPTRLISPADARVIKYELKKDTIFPVKGCSFSLDALLERPDVAQDFADGTAIVLRLAPFDYHRFCYVDDAQVGSVWTAGRLYEAVHPYAIWAHAKSFTVNVRDCCVLHTRHFGDVLHVDVGALGVGAITQFDQSGSSVSRGQEKGLFSLGGSTIVLVFKRNTVVMDADIEENSASGIETMVRYGEGIGSRKRSD
jgi:phosphatidylserine decarboxylase